MFIATQPFGNKDQMFISVLISPVRVTKHPVNHLRFDSVNRKSGIARNSYPRKAASSTSKSCNLRNQLLGFGVAKVKQEVLVVVLNWKSVLCQVRLRSL